MGVTTYAFQRCLGRGGFGEVYLATRRSGSGAERQVAVKVLRAGLEGRELAVRRLKDEARALAVLDHPSVLKVIELTRVGGRVALVTEYVDGWDLSCFVRPEARLPERIVLTILAEVAHALDVALTTASPETGNPLGLVHRDIKPENIRLSRHGQIKLLDFGIARSDELGREARTATGNLNFTPGYTAPECFLSLCQNPATDVFALGATVYRLLVGERFFQGLKLSQQAALCASRRKFEAHIEERVARIESSHPGLRPLVAGCLQWDSSARPAAADIARRAQRIADDLSGPLLARWIDSRPPPTGVDIAGAPLTGQILEEDDPTTVVEFAPWPPPPPVPVGLVPIAPALESTPAAPRTVPPAPAAAPHPLLVGLGGLVLGGTAALVVLGLMAGLASVFLR